MVARSSGAGRKISTSAGAFSSSQTRSSPEIPSLPVAVAETTTRSKVSSASSSASAMVPSRRLELSRVARRLGGARAQFRNTGVPPDASLKVPVIDAGSQIARGTALRVPEKLN
jgi:hypothetical protein